MDSYIRLRQLNQQDLSGYISQTMFPILRGSGINISGKHIIPTGSGISNLGSSGSPFQELFINKISIPSGSGVYFGPHFFTAYTSGTSAVVQVGSYYLTASSQGLTIIGPSGASGVTGVTGPSGASGLSITGATGINSTGVRFLLSNGAQTNTISLPSGATGATGVSLTGFTQSGLNLTPQFSNGTTGLTIIMPSGATGQQGVVGGINIVGDIFTGFTGGDIAPNWKIYNINPDTVNNPTLRFVKGMTYSIDYSGLKLTGITFPNGSYYNSNYFIQSGITGYLKLVFFDDGVLDTVLNNPSTGRFIRSENSFDVSAYNTLDANLTTDDLVSDIIEDVSRNKITFKVNFDATSSYKYGFQKYVFSDGSVMDSSMYWGFYVLGNVETSYFGPSGAIGATGPQGIAGPQGERGAMGLGTSGVGITGIERSSNDIRFLLTDGTTTDWTSLPAGGPTGPTGPAGTSGTSISGSTGPTGPTGPAGASDNYYASYYVTDIQRTGFYGFDRTTSGASTWVLCTGTGRRFGPGDRIRTTISAMIGNTYSSAQQLIFSDETVTGRYFYGRVDSFNTNDGAIEFTSLDSPYPPAGLVSGKIEWYNYGLVDTNLGGLGSQGPTGPQGPSGARGDTGRLVFICNTSPSGLSSYNLRTLSALEYDAWDLSFTDEENSIAFDLTKFSTGQTVLVKISNLGVKTTDEYNLITWYNDIRFPYSVNAPAPNPGLSTVYTFVRFPDYMGNDRIYCTYSANYSNAAI